MAAGGLLQRLNWKHNISLSMGDGLVGQPSLTHTGAEVRPEAHIVIISVTQSIEIDPPQRDPLDVISTNFRLSGPTCLVQTGEDDAPQICMRQGRDGISSQKTFFERHRPPITIDPAGPDRDAQCPSR